MKLNNLLKGLTSFKETLLNAIKGKQDINAPSRAVRVRCAEMAYAASVRRGIRHQALSGIRRNTRGLPLGFSLHQVMTRRAIKAALKVRRVIDGKWKEGCDSTRVEQAKNLNEALKFGSEFRRMKMTKLARRVSGGKRRRSCSARTSMVDIMERRELLQGRA